MAHHLPVRKSELCGTYFLPDLVNYIVQEVALPQPFLCMFKNV
jgi:hypothetical protein